MKRLLEMSLEKIFRNIYPDMDFQSLTVSDCVEIACQFELSLDKLIIIPAIWHNEPGFRRAYALAMVVEYLADKAVNTDIINWCNAAREQYNKAFVQLAEDPFAFVKSITANAYDAGFPGGVKLVKENDEETKILSLLKSHAVNLEGKLVYRKEDGRFFSIMDDHEISNTIQDKLKIKRHATAGIIDVPRVTLNEGMRKEQSKLCFEQVKNDQGEPSQIIFSGVDWGTYFSFDNIRFTFQINNLEEGLGAYRAERFVNSKLKATHQIEVTSPQCLLVEQKYGIYPVIRETIPAYVPHMTYRLVEREPKAIPNTLTQACPSSLTSLVKSQKLLEAKVRLEKRMNRTKKSIHNKLKVEGFFQRNGQDRADSYRDASSSKVSRLEYQRKYGFR